MEGSSEEKREPKNTKAAESRTCSGRNSGHWAVTGNENATAKESAVSGDLNTPIIDGLWLLLKSSSFIAFSLLVLSP